MNRLMSTRKVSYQNLNLVFLILVSFFGLVLSASFVIDPYPSRNDFEYRNLVAGSAFSMLCILGILFALFPGSCSTKLKTWKSHGESYSSITKTNLKTHHPSCENYATHVLRIGKRTFCATCSGLAVGAIIVLIGTGWYFFGSLSLGEPLTLFFIVLLGCH
jgi:hypothetical protein